MSSACTTISSGICPPGNAACIRSYVCMIGRLSGIPSTPLSTVFSRRLGIASAISSPPASTADTSGRRSTRSRIADHTRDSPSPRRRRRCTNGTRPFSTLSPSFDSTAGRTVSEPSIETATTRIVPTANDMNVALPVRNMPAIAIITVSPETSTARPEVAAAIARAASLEWPARRSSRSRRR